MEAEEECRVVRMAKGESREKGGQGSNARIVIPRGRRGLPRELYTERQLRIRVENEKEEAAIFYIASE